MPRIAAYRKNGNGLGDLLILVLLIRSVTSTPRRQGNIPGGVTGLTPGQINKGWRIDYCMASDSLKSRLKDAYILPEVYHWIIVLVCWK